MNFREVQQAIGWKRAKLRLGLHAVLSRTYAQDGLVSVHTHAFMQDPAFVRAYARGVKAIGGTDDYRIHWRAHIALWVASIASRLDGDFVECGVNKGFMSSAIMEYLDWNALDRDFYLLDTFAGMDERFVAADERDVALQHNTDNLETGFYVKGADSVRANFAEWPRAHIVEGVVPETLAQVPSRHVAYLHLDMNCAPPEIAALEYFWDRLVPGATVLLDDYAYRGYEPQGVATDEFARAHNVTVCALPTGQGLLIKPPSRVHSPGQP
ncbi:class I SAM-dependent methyltransferase [Mycobacterium simiae]|uniref:Class I SAM-dependent methyltransferase n=1 Tax=Mycobacterium simiae TaxID=1784 RepID=A0A5B1BUG7_MYCSI|nr:TylF/MycF/NovP-related O-methyltransferase [Mycobacterium simiae]KAA1251986.1 class I SAM-dependent methyltransferase [Mycobacterium simiae]